MYIKDGFVVRNIAGSWIAVPVGARTADFSGVISLTETGALLMKLLSKDSDIASLVSALVSEYEVDEDTAKKDVEAFIKNLCEMGLIVE